MYRPKLLLVYDTQAQIQISLNQLTLTLTIHGRRHGVYPVAVGKPSTPTPAGAWRIRAKVVNPAMPALGSRWMGLDIPWGEYGIHGTNAPWSIGRYISNGCIRMHNHHVEEVFDLVAIWTPVIIYGHYQKVLGPGSSGPEVSALQLRLRRLGFYDGPVDGIYGPRTEEAVRRFQSSVGLKPDGLVGPSTRSALDLRL